MDSFHKGIQHASTSTLYLDVMFKPMHACAVKPEVLKSWTLEIDYSRAPCVGADQKIRGLWEQDCVDHGTLSACAIDVNFIPILTTRFLFDCVYSS